MLSFLQTIESQLPEPAANCRRARSLRCDLARSCNATGCEPDINPLALCRFAVRLEKNVVSNALQFLACCIFGYWLQENSACCHVGLRNTTSTIYIDAEVGDA